MVRRPVRVLVALAVMGAIVAGACGSSGYEYVKNSDKGLYFKIPDSWTQFAVKVDNGRPDNVGTSRAWQVIVDGAANATTDHFTDDSLPADPVGTAVIVPLVTSAPRDSISQTYLRSTILDPENGDPSGDPLRLISDGNPNLELVSYKELATDDGFWGNHIVINVRRSDGEWVTVGQTAMVDTAMSNLYRLQVVCKSSCYETHISEINRIFDSWTIRKR